MDDLEQKLKAAQEEITMLRRKKVVMPSRAAELLRDIKRMAQKGLDAKTMTTKDEKLRGIVKKIKD